MAAPWNAPWNAPRTHSDAELDVLRRSIVCFYADEKFMDMAVVAVTTLLQHTPAVAVGVLAPSKRIAEAITRQVPVDDLDRVQRRVAAVKPFFDRWNPTQYKLDIAQFCDTRRYDYVYWMDSDTLTYADIADTLVAFARAPALFLMTPDHVNYDQRFCALWLQQHGDEAPVVPQSCFMGFKACVLAPFFQEWRTEWSAWITPYPFANYPDPRPHFVGSAFCAEQYALGVALARFCRLRDIEQSTAIMWFTRQSVAIPKLPGDDTKPCYDVDEEDEEEEDENNTVSDAAAAAGTPAVRTDIQPVAKSSDDSDDEVQRQRWRRAGVSFRPVRVRASQQSSLSSSSSSSPSSSSLLYRSAGVPLRTWVSYPVESESGSSPSSSLSSTPLTSEDGSLGSFPPALARRCRDSAASSSPPPSSLSSSSSSSYVLDSFSVTTYVVVSVPSVVRRSNSISSYSGVAGGACSISQSFPYAATSFSLSSLCGGMYGDSISSPMPECLCHSKLSSQVPALILADGRTDLGHTDPTNGGRSAIIDKFFGFFHYYHQNKRSMFSWWRSASGSPQFVVCPCLRPPVPF